MLFKVIEKFGPESGDAWTSYLEWRKFNFDSFDSVDSMLRPDLFSPESVADWDNCVNADFKLNLITNVHYAKKVSESYDSCEIIGVDIELEDEPESKLNLLGYDILDEYCGISLLTNWGVDEEGFINRHLQCNGLILDFKDALSLRDLLRKDYSEDGHAQACSIWAVYEVSY